MKNAQNVFKVEVMPPYSSKDFTNAYNTQYLIVPDLLPNGIVSIDRKVGKLN